jgi:ribosomal protein S3AE
MAEKKRFIEVRIPILNQETKVLGTPEELDGKTIKLDLTRKLRGKGLTITFRIFNDNGKLVAVPKKMELVKSYIRRMLRKRINYVEDSFVANCSDVKATLKPFLITRKRVSRAVRKNLRNTAREFLQNYVKDKTYNDICNELLAGTIQREMLPRLKKVYPLSFYDLRVFETKELEKINLEEATKEPVAPKADEDIQAEVVEETQEEAVEEVKGGEAPAGEEEEGKKDKVQEVKEEEAEEEPVEAEEEQKE